MCDVIFRMGPAVDHFWDFCTCLAHGATPNDFEVLTGHKYVVSRQSTVYDSYVGILNLESHSY